ncbi:MAG: hypothetical protein O7D91_17545 [Planctomycetota bacterium]|nr:hypothetical protein [Planctomycetota bacterium]
MIKQDSKTKAVILYAKDGYQVDLHRDPNDEVWLSIHCPRFETTMLVTEMGDAWHRQKTIAELVEHLGI